MVWPLGVFTLDPVCILGIYIYIYIEWLYLFYFIFSFRIKRIEEETIMFVREKNKKFSWYREILL